MKFKDLIGRDKEWESFEDWIGDLDKIEDFQPSFQKIKKSTSIFDVGGKPDIPLRLYNIPVPNKYGKIFTHRLPYEYGREVYKEWKKNKIRYVVSLFDSADKRFYKKGNVELIHYPIRDYSIPTNIDSFEKFMDKLLNVLQRKKNISVHCFGGHGRTGIVIGILYALLNSTDPRTAIKNVRKINPKYIETTEQEDFIIDYVEIYQ